MYFHLMDNILYIIKYIYIYNQQDRCNNKVTFVDVWCSTNI